MSHHASTSNNNDKAEPITKEEWQSRLESFEFKQADMNRLIMNYLVTGEQHLFYFQIFHFAEDCILIQTVRVAQISFRLQRGSKRQLKSFKPRPEWSHRSR